MLLWKYRTQTILNDFPKTSCSPQLEPMDHVCSLERNQILHGQSRLSVPRYWQLGAACKMQRGIPPWDGGEVAHSMGQPGCPCHFVPGQAHVWLVQLCQSQGSHRTITHSRGTAHPSGGTMCHLQSRFVESQAVVASSGSGSNVHCEIRSSTVGNSREGESGRKRSLQTWLQRS